MYIRFSLFTIRSSNFPISFQDSINPPLPVYRTILSEISLSSYVFYLPGTRPSSPFIRKVFLPTDFVSVIRPPELLTVLKPYCVTLSYPTSGTLGSSVVTFYVTNLTIFRPLSTFTVGISNVYFVCRGLFSQSFSSLTGTVFIGSLHIPLLSHTNLNRCTITTSGPVCQWSLHHFSFRYNLTQLTYYLLFNF